MKPICIKCRRFFRPAKTGFYFLEGMPKCDGVRSGNSDADNWQPYKLWVGDLWECPECKSQIIVGTGKDAQSEHFKPNFKELVSKLGADQFQVNDC